MSTRGVVVNFDSVNGFRDLGPSNGGAWARAGSGCWRGSGGITPGKFFEIFDAKSRVWGQFGPESILIEG